MDINNNIDVKNVLESLSPESREELDHILESEGYNYDTIENILSIPNEKSGELSSLISKFADSVKQGDKNESVDEIIDIIK